MGGLPGQQIHQRRQQKADGGGKQQDIHQRHVPEQDGAVKNVQQHLMVQQRHGQEKQGPETALGNSLLLLGDLILVIHKVSLIVPRPGRIR